MNTRGVTAGGHVILLGAALCSVAAPAIGSPEADPGVIRLSVYFSNTALGGDGKDCTRVFPVERSVPATGAVASAALRALFQGWMNEPCDAANDHCDPRPFRNHP